MAFSLSFISTILILFVSSSSPCCCINKKKNNNTHSSNSSNSSNHIIILSLYYSSFATTTATTRSVATSTTNNGAFAEALHTNQQQQQYLHQQQHHHHQQEKKITSRRRYNKTNSNLLVTNNNSNNSSSRDDGDDSCYDDGDNDGDGIIDYKEIFSLSKIDKQQHQHEQQHQQQRNKDVKRQKRRSRNHNSTRRKTRRARQKSNNIDDINNNISNNNNNNNNNILGNEKIRITDFAQLDFILEKEFDIHKTNNNNNNNNNNGKRMATLLSDLRDKLNPEEISEKVGNIVDNDVVDDDVVGDDVVGDDYDDDDDDFMEINEDDEIIMHVYQKATTVSTMHGIGSIENRRNLNVMQLPVKQQQQQQQQEYNQYNHLHHSALLHTRGGGGNSGSRDGLGKPSPTNIQNMNQNCTALDGIGKSISLFTAGVVVIQSIHSLLIHDDYALLDEIAANLLSIESAIALKTIRKIIQNFPEHGVIDVFSEYPTKDVVVSILALSRLQRAVYTSGPKSNYNWPALFLEEDTFFDNGRKRRGRRRRRLKEIFQRHENINESITFLDNDNNIDDEDVGAVNIEQGLLADLAHYAIFANAAYGWKMGLLGGKLHIGDLKTLLKRTGIEENNVIETNWKSKTHLPAYFLVRDVKKKKIVLCIRGTLSPKDILTDLCCTAEDFMSHEEEEMANNDEGPQEVFKGHHRARAHQGMVNSARGVAKVTREVIKAELDANPGYNLVLVGHSLGGGVASILGTFWRDTFPGLKVYAYGCPCVAPLNAYPTIDNSIISVVGEGDPFSVLSLGHLADVSTALSKLCENEDLRDEVLNRTKDMNVNDMRDENVIWCTDTLEAISTCERVTEKFYPCGRIFHMKGNLFGSDLDNVALKEVRSEDAFRHLKLHPRMFDLSLHIPHRYELLLARMLAKVTNI